MTDASGAEPARDRPFGAGASTSGSSRYCKEAIRDGEVFQVVPSQRFDVECSASPLDVYRVLRTLNPSPYMYYFQLQRRRGPRLRRRGIEPRVARRRQGRRGR